MLRIRNDHSRSNVIEHTELSPNFDKRAVPNIDIQQGIRFEFGTNGRGTRCRGEKCRGGVIFPSPTYLIRYERSRCEMSRGEMSRGAKCLRYEVSRDEMSLYEKDGTGVTQLHFDHTLILF